MHFFAERGEPLAVTTPEVTEDRLVGVHAEELAYDTSMVRTSASESLGEGPRRRRMRRPRRRRSSMRQKTATTKVPRPREEASFAPVGLVATERREVPPLSLEPSRKLAHGVSYVVGRR